MILLNGNLIRSFRYWFALELPSDYEKKLVSCVSLIVYCIWIRIFWFLGATHEYNVSCVSKCRLRLFCNLIYNASRQQFSNVISSKQTGNKQQTKITYLSRAIKGIYRRIVLCFRTNIEIIIDSIWFLACQIRDVCILR